MKRSDPIRKRRSDPFRKKGNYWYWRERTTYLYVHLNGGNSHSRAIETVDFDKMLSTLMDGRGNSVTVNETSRCPWFNCHMEG